MCSTLHTCPSQNTTLRCVTNQITDEYYSGESWVPTTCLSDQDISQLSLNLNRISSIHPSISLSHPFSLCAILLVDSVLLLFFLLFVSSFLWNWWWLISCPFSKLPSDYSSILPFLLSSNLTYVTVCPCAACKIIIIKMYVGTSAYLPLNT